MVRTPEAVVDIDRDPDPSRPVGDVTADTPAVATDPPATVTLNYARAFDPDGAHAIRLTVGEQYIYLTWRQAAQAVILLGVSGPDLQNVRQNAGYQT
jgi:hypothetical protein